MTAYPDPCPSCRTGRAVVTAAVGAGVTSALGLAHLLEIPGKHSLHAAAFLAVHHNLYGGYAIVGGVGEIVGVGGLMAAGTWSRSSERDTSVLALCGASALALALGLFFVGLAPLNAKIASWTPTTIAPNWREVRNQWEVLHLINLGLAGTAVGICFRMLRTNCAPHGPHQ